MREGGHRTSPAPPPGDRAASPAHSLADILRVQLFPASLALEAAQMPVFVQGHEGLAVFDLHPAALATWKKEWGTAVILVGVGESSGVAALHRRDFRHHRGSESGPRDGTGGTVQLRALHDGRCERTLSADCMQPGPRARDTRMNQTEAPPSRDARPGLRKQMWTCTGAPCSGHCPKHGPGSRVP